MSAYMGRHLAITALLSLSLAAGCAAPAPEEEAEGMSSQLGAESEESLDPFVGKVFVLEDEVELAAGERTVRDRTYTYTGFFKFCSFSVEESSEARLLPAGSRYEVVSIDNRIEARRYGSDDAPLLPLREVTFALRGIDAKGEALPAGDGTFRCRVGSSKPLTLDAMTSSIEDVFRIED